MRVVVQRVKKAKVVVDDLSVGKIDQGIMALVGFQETDDDEAMTYIIDKLVGLRIFEDKDGKMNESIKDHDFGLLIVPNFTLYGDCRRGKRPSFTGASKPDVARNQFKKFVALAKERYNHIETGQFQADMQVHLVNDGPVTVLLDSDKVF